MVTADKSRGCRWPLPALRVRAVKAMIPSLWHPTLLMSFCLFETTTRSSTNQRVRWQHSKRRRPRQAPLQGAQVVDLIKVHSFLIRLPISAECKNGTPLKSEIRQMGALLDCSIAQLAAERPPQAYLAIMGECDSAIRIPSHRTDGPLLRQACRQERSGIGVFFATVQGLNEPPRSLDEAETKGPWRNCRNQIGSKQNKYALCTYYRPHSNCFTPLPQGDCHGSIAARRT